MNIGNLNKRISLQKYDADIEIYKEIATVWANIKKPKMKTIIVANNPASSVIWEFEIRNRQDIQKNWHIVYKNKIYQVEYCYDTEDMQTTIIVCTERVM